MDDKERQLLSDLLTHQRVATMAVLVDGAPFASLVPFALTPGFDAALVHASGLARHSAGLTPGASISLLVAEPDSRTDTNPAQLARATLQGSVVPIERESDAYSQAREQYLAKFPKSAITFQLGDFTLYRLQFESCRFVAGFAKAFDLTPTDLGQLA